MSLKLLSSEPAHSVRISHAVMPLAFSVLFYSKGDVIVVLTVFFNEQLRGYLNEILLDQIPNLIDLQRYLEHLAVVEPPIAKKDFVLEQVSRKFELCMKMQNNFI